jgi:triosephosphate isomerase (TIM)
MQIPSGFSEHQDAFSVFHCIHQSALLISPVCVIEYFRENDGDQGKEHFMRKPFMAGNWKMNGDAGQVKDFVDNFTAPADVVEKRQIVICAPATLLAVWNDYGKKNKPYIQIGAQNAHWAPKGAYTGELSAGMLKEAGCYCCIIGHSERRQYFHETDAEVNKKMNALLGGGLIPIVCVGETLEEREAGKTEQVVSTQVKGSILESAGAGGLSEIVVAYEPVWAIGTGKTATTAQAEEVCAMIRRQLAGALGKEVAERIRILYGGSMKPDNVDELMSQPNIDGGLVGGASLKASDFSRIAAYLE